MTRHEHLLNLGFKGNTRHEYRKKLSDRTVYVIETGLAWWVTANDDRRKHLWFTAVRIRSHTDLEVAVIYQSLRPLEEAT